MPFTETSKHLQAFVKDLTAESKYLRQTRRPLFSNQSAAFLQKIYRQLLTAETTWSRSKHDILSSLTADSSKAALTKNSSYSSIPPEIKTQLESQPSVTHTYQFRVGPRTVEAHIVLPSIHRPDVFHTRMEAAKTKKAIYRIYLWLSVAFKYASHHCSQTLHMYFYMSDHLKVKPLVLKEPMNWVNANTAFTTHCQPATNITLFREEEWFKVCIHETFHCLGLDFSAFDQGAKVADQAILRHFNKNIINIADLRSYETYCEMWAEILNTMFIAHETTREIGDFDTILNKMEKMLRVEQVWSGFQCVKLLDHFQLKYADIINITNTTNNPNNINHKYHEKTNAFCYYVLKTILLFHLDDFIKWVATKNPAKSIRFELTTQNTLSYAELITSLHNSPDFVRFIAGFDGWFANNASNRGTIMDTMRMTVNELV